MALRQEVGYSFISGIHPLEVANMHLVVDRPRPINYVHPNGGEAVIDFAWGADTDSVPVEVMVRVCGQIVRAKTGHWSNFGEARRCGFDLANAWYSRYNC